MNALWTRRRQGTSPPPPPPPPPPSTTTGAFPSVDVAMRVLWCDECIECALLGGTTSDMCTRCSQHQSPAA